MIEIRVRENESLESALRRFREICKREGIVSAIMEKAYYRKTGRKRKRRNAKHRQKSYRQAL